MNCVSKIFGAIVIIASVIVVYHYGVSAESIIAAATVDGVIFAIMALYAEGAKFKISLGADLIMRLDNEFNGEIMKPLRVKAASTLQQNNKTDEQYEEAEPILDFFEKLGLFVRRGALDKEFVWHTFFHWFHGYWSATKDYVEQRNKKNKAVYKDVIYLSKCLVDLEKKNGGEKELKKSEEGLKKFLETEVFDNKASSVID